MRKSVGKTSQARKAAPKGKAVAKRKAVRKPAAAAKRAAAVKRATSGGVPAVVPASPPPPAPAAEPVVASVGLRLESSCTLREAADLHFAMLGIKAGTEPLDVDAGAVERIDTAGLQLLACLVRARAAMGGAVRWAAVSPELRRSAARLGMQDLLALPAGTPGDAP